MENFEKFEKNFNKIFSKNLKDMLAKKDISQNELAKRIGVSQQSVSYWCTGVKVPRMKKVDQLCEILMCKRSDLMQEHLLTASDSFSNTSHTIHLLGRVAAGTPIFAEENIVGELDVPSIWSKNDEYYGLTIKGNSMEPRISNGDIVIVHSQEDAESGEIVIATLNGDDAVCKRLMKYGTTILLRSFNSEYDDIDVTANQDFRIWGKVVESRHKF